MEDVGGKDFGATIRRGLFFHGSSAVIRSLFQRRPRQKPILAPRAATSAWRRHLSACVATLPPSAIPIAATIAGGVAVLLVAAMVVGGNDAGDGVPGKQLAAVEPAADTARDLAPEADAAALPADDIASASPDRAEAGAGDQTPDAANEPRAGAADAAGEEAAAAEPAPDQQRTAAIPPAMPGASQMKGPVVPVAETEDEILALEAIQRSEVEEDVGPPSDEWTAAIPQEPAPSLVPATTTQYVNLRAAPDDDGEVLEVVPALASIEAEGECNWCAVTYEGRQGYIYKTFISYE